MKDFTLTGTVAVSGSKDAVGGVAGYNSGTIDNVTNNAAINAQNCYNVGGIAGFNNGYYGSSPKGNILNWPVVTKAKKSIANFKVRQGMPVGAKVTLRGDNMYVFVDKFFNISLPRVRDFKGVSRNSFDGREIGRAHV